MKHSQTGIAKKILFLMVGLLVAFGANAQSITVSGEVTDSYGEPLIGASVLAEGTTTGTSTDIDGRYTIKVAPTGKLVFSYVGYDPMTVEVNGRSEVNVMMQENSVMLNEVVAIGYGVVKKSDATGSVSVIKPDEIEAGIATSVQDMLVGQTPGVVVTTSGGPEGAANIRIRGGASLNASNEPLVVVDGVPLDNTGVQGMSNSIGMINPENIESMTVLKDASATAIYGSRASNGVIIITTKKGSAGKPTVNFATNFYVNTARKTWDVLSGDQYRALVAERKGIASAEYLGLGNRNTDWQNEVLRTTLSSDYSLSVGGTAGWLPYRADVSYTNSNGIILTSSMDRLTVGFNLTPKFFDNHLSVNANAKGYYMHNNFGDAGALSGAMNFNPTVPVHTFNPIIGGTAIANDELYAWNHYKSAEAQLWNGYTEVYTTSTGDDGVTRSTVEKNATMNPVGQLLQKNNYANVLRSNGSLQLDYAFHFLPELHANLNLGYDISESREVEAIAPNSRTAWTNHDNYGGGYQTNKYQFKSNTLLDFFLNYKKDVEAIRSNFDVTAGYSWQRFFAEGHFSGANGNGDFRTTPGFEQPVLTAKGYELNYNPATVGLVGQNFQDDTVSPTGNYHWKNHLQLLSFFGRLNYILCDRYLLTVTVRGDATSRFSKENRWGIFPAVALGWKINDEKWMRGAQGWLSDLKLRLGWGETGQQDVGNYYNYLVLYTIAAPTSAYPDGKGGWYRPAYPQGYNTDLKWETTTTYNVALDFGFINNRITGSVDVYKRDTKDLLSYVTVPAGSSTTNMLNRNIGTLENYGVEFNLQARPVVTDNFTWTLSYNIGYNHNEITSLYDPNVRLKTGDISGGTGNKVQVNAVGHAANSFYLYQQVYDKDGKPVEGAYVDQNGDGQIDDKDLIINKSPDPKITMTFGSSFRYKKWDLGFNLRASLGNYVYNNVLSTKANYSSLFQNGYNNLVVTDNYFEQPQYMSDYFLRNGSFLRCDNINLGYTWDNLCDYRLRLRLFGAVQNPFVITKYNGIDPEVFGGIDNSVYPKATTYSLGLVATF